MAVDNIQYAYGKNPNRFCFESYLPFMLMLNISVVNLSFGYIIFFAKLSNIPFNICHFSRRSTFQMTLNNTLSIKHFNWHSEFQMTSSYILSGFQHSLLDIWHFGWHSIILIALYRHFPSSPANTTVLVNCQQIC